jgi:hypothetical protein
VTPSPPKVAAERAEVSVNERWARVRMLLIGELGREHQCHDESCDQIEVEAYRVTMHARAIVEGRV